MQTSPSIFLNLMFKLFFQYMDEVMVFWMDELSIYDQTEEEHFKHIELDFKSLERLV